MDLADVNDIPIMALVKRVIEPFLDDGRIYRVKDTVDRLQAAIAIIKVDVDTMIVAMPTIQSTIRIYGIHVL